MPFSRVLIANRGEIAVRLIRACARLGLRSVAVYSDADADALHVHLADSAVPIGPSEARASYLDGARLIDAARRSGAQAIHPGYGFLAENADFARQCLAAGLVFVGPAPDIIAAMGAKIEAKRIAEKAGVSCVPGYHGDDQSDATLLREAQRIGAPLLIKASAGGGGRGMRRVDDLEDFLPNVALARQEATAAFADPTLLIERFVAAPRHIEVQILGDRYGNVRHLFERDCSVQRNYQKIIEEAPAPNLDPALRRQILAAAVALAKNIGYDNAGTVEFVIDADDSVAYFLEMNTRLQVEHPVTEMITGIDLVEWQLRVAAGEALNFSQTDITCAGWAIEARVAAEDPAAGYQPQTGVINTYLEPDRANLRIDTGIRRGSIVTPYYDSMLAKVIAHGHDRNAAIRSLREGLSNFRIGGVGVNSGFLIEVLGIDEFTAGRHLTNCLERAFPRGWQASPVTGIDLALATLGRHLALECGPHVSPWSTLGAWRLGERSGREGAGYYYVRGDAEHLAAITVRGRCGHYRIERDGVEVLTVHDATYGEGRLAYRSLGQRDSIGMVIEASRVTLLRRTDNPQFEVLLADQVLLSEAAANSHGGNAVLAPTPGLVTEVLVSAGATVTAGDPVLVMEAMKLLQRLCAPAGGVVAQIHFQAGDTVNGGDCLMTIESTASDPE